MRKGPVWSLKRTVDDNDPAATTPGADSSAFDGLEGVAPIDNAPVPNPATKQPKGPIAPAAVDDFFQEQLQADLMGLPLELWEEVVPGPVGRPLIVAKGECMPAMGSDQNPEMHLPLAPVILGSLVLSGPLALRPQDPAHDRGDSIWLRDASPKRGGRRHASAKGR